jgi:hypothetical protein
MMATGGSDPFREGVRAVTGLLGALKDALEEQFEDLRAQSDLAPDKAREAARSTMRKAQETVDEMRDRLDFVPRREFDALKAEVEALARRLDAHQGGPAHADADGPKPEGGGTSRPADPADAGGPSGDETSVEDGSHDFHIEGE